MELRVPFCRKNYDFLCDSKKRINVMYGSAGSGKSWSVAQHLMFNRLLSGKKVRILVIRKTYPSLRKSCWLLFNDLIEQYDLRKVYNITINRSDLFIGVGNNAEMFFTSLDDVSKLKSIEKINYVWVEEATEITKDEYMQINLRVRGINHIGWNQLYFTFNPVDENSFWKTICDSPAYNTAICHSTYKDNPFLPPEYIEQLENLVNLDETYHKIYALGLWATPTDLIYTNWYIYQLDWPLQFDETIYGLDFGFNNPTAIIEVNVRDKELYEREVLYETGLTNTQLIEKMKFLIPNKDAMIIADCAEPARIEEIKQAGFNVYACEKGRDSIRHSIDAVKRHRVHISKDSINLVKEKRGYKWAKKDDVTLDEPVKFNDHLMDAERYAVQRLVSGVSAGLQFLSSPFGKTAEETEFELAEQATWSEID